MSKRLKILIIGEGTYPYVKGGVSSWIHELICGLPDFDFHLIFVGSKKSDYGEKEYELPSNLLSLEEYYLFDEYDIPEPKPIKAKKSFIESLKKISVWLESRSKDSFPKELATPEFYTQKLTYEEFLYSFESWEFIVHSYLKKSDTSSFIDYFWTIRNMHAPLWRIAKSALKTRDFDIIHSPSTGYAGFLAALLHGYTKRPFLLTEHGIYTKERKIDMLDAKWISDAKTFLQKDISNISHTKEAWIAFFESLGDMAYESADKIVSLYEKARSTQILYGADPKKCMVVPNGVDIEKLRKFRKSEKENIIVLIGRVVPIKDIKTFIKALKITVGKIPDTQGWIVGPEDEDPAYAKECRYLVQTMGLEDNIKFLGYKNIDEILPEAKIVTLTSISEGMPLVVLEGFAAGIPAVTTDVGSCSQLINGGVDEEDRELGAAGRVVPIANPVMTAYAYIDLLEDEVQWRKCSEVAIKRVESYYNMEKFLNNYKSLYLQMGGIWQE